MKKQFLVFMLLLLSSFLAFPQAAINTDGSQPDPSAGLEVKFSNKGFLPPRIALTALNAASPVTTPATGLLVYNTATAGTTPNNVIPGYYYWNGARWVAVSAPSGTSTGDMLYWNGTQWSQLAVGATGQSLIINGGIPTWGTGGSISSPTVMTNPVTNLSSVSAVCGGNVSDGGSPVTDKGVCWATTANPTISNSKTSEGFGAGPFTSSITGLMPNTIYHVRAYATNSLGTSYGADVTFTTINISTTVVTSITATSAASGGTIDSDGGSTIVARGVCWSTVTAPTLADKFTSNGSGTGTFTSSITGLTGNTRYFIRAYLTNGLGTFYGNELTFTTASIVPIVTTSDTSNVTKTTAICGGTVVNDGGSPILSRGVCWNTAANPTTSNSKTTDGSGMGSFSSSITGLVQGTTYYVRAYAINSAGTSYGSNVTFMTKGTLATVTTDEITGVTLTTAIAIGNVTSAGVPAVTERGFCWKKSANPTIADSKVACGSGTGSFNGSLTVLAPGTTYYIRAYATNAQGTTYGQQLTFTTQSAYYVGFENGMPTGWTGMWTVNTSNHFDGYYSLYSEHTNDTISVTRTITTTGGQISFRFISTFYDCWNGANSNRVEFYIDKVKQTTCYESNWAFYTFPLSLGTHTFKWKNIGRPASSCWSDGTNGSAWIDYVIISN